MTASSLTVPWMRAILAKGGYSGLGCTSNLAASTWPPTVILLGVAALGGGGGGGALLEIMPPRTPPGVPPGIPPGTPPTTPTAADGGGSGSSLTREMVFGMTVGAFIKSSAEMRLITLTGAAGAGGGGGGGGGGGATRDMLSIVLGSACVMINGIRIATPTKIISTI